MVSKYKAATLQKGVTATLLSRCGKWWLARVNGQEAYVKEKDVMIK